MRVAAAITLLALACCREHQAELKRDKQADLKASEKLAYLEAANSCYLSQSRHTHDKYLLATRCEPLAKRERIAGTWFIGFDGSWFFEGPPPTGDQPTESHQLIVPTPLCETAHKGDASGDTAAYEIVFIGRRSLLNLKPEPSNVVADEIISLRRVPMQLPPWMPRRAFSPTDGARLPSPCVVVPSPDDSEGR